MVNVDGCVVMGNNVFMLDFILSVNLVDDEFWINICFEMHDTNLFYKLHSDQQLYSTTLLEHDSVRENALGIT